MEERDVEGLIAGHDIVVVGASAGGVEALTDLVANRPAANADDTGRQLLPAIGED